MADEYTEPLYDAVTDISESGIRLPSPTGLLCPQALAAIVCICNPHCACILVFLGHIALLLRLNRVRVYMLSQ